MPNTLAHIGVHVPITRALVRGADAKWIYLGCVLPDVPWILQRVLVALPGVDAAGVRLHVAAQASLLGSLLLAAVVAALACRPVRAGVILAVGALAHLLLDACQIKWANGSLLFAPIDWRLVRFDLAWPEHPATYALSALGLGVFAVESLRARRGEAIDLTARPRPRLLVALVLLVIWGLWPLPFHGALLARDNYSLATLLAEERTGRPIEMDRARYVAPPAGPVVVALTGERLSLTAPLVGHDAVVSLRGAFTSETTIRVDAHHDHTGGRLRVPIRDIFSYTGLLLVGTSWVVAIGRQRSRSRERDPELP